MDTERQPASPFSVLASSRFLLGLGAIFLGVLFLADNLDWFDVDPLLDWWPLLLVGFGVSKLLAGRIGLGVVWTVIGTLIFVDNVITSIEPDDFFFPLVLIGFGTLMITRALERQRGRELGLTAAPPEGAGWRHRVRHGAWRDRGRYATDAADVHAFALMGGATRRCHSQEFRGGEAIAVMGGSEIDLRSARLAPEGAVLDVLAFWGVVEVLVPPGWEVDNQVLPLMGGVADRTRPLLADSATPGWQASARQPTPPPPPAPPLPTTDERGAAAAASATGAASARPADDEDDDGYLADFAPPRPPVAATAATATGDREPLADGDAPTVATSSTDRAGSAARPRLILRGVALMGGVDVGHERDKDD